MTEFVDMRVGSTLLAVGDAHQEGASPGAPSGSDVRATLSTNPTGLVGLRAYDDLAAARRALVRSVEAETRH